MNKIFKKVAVSLTVGLFFLPGLVTTGCSDWTEVEAQNYYEELSQGYRNNIKDYLASPHKVMFGWFGNWVGKGGSSMQYSLCGLPDSLDFVSLWLCWGPLSAAQQADLQEFQARGSRAVLCWRAGNIGDNLTPEGEDAAEFWGIDTSSEEALIAAAEKYAMAIVDTCRKYDVGGFDYDIEDWGTLMNSTYPSVPNAFMRKLYEEFEKDGRWLVADIPGGTAWLTFYDQLEEDVVLSLKYLAWQTYDLTGSGLDNFFESVRSHKPDIFEQVFAKSIVTATFEEAAKKFRFEAQTEWEPSCGLEYGGHGAYHIEYDYPGNPDYPTVRSVISTLNPPVAIE